MLTVNIDEFAADRHCHSPHPIEQGLLKLRWLEQLKDPPKSVITRDTVGQLEKLFEPLMFGFTKLCYLFPSVCSTDRSAYSYY